MSVNNQTVTTQLVDDITINATKSSEIKNNICEITLRNSPSNYDNVNIYGTHVLPGSYLLKFNAQDKISLYLKHTNDAADYTGTSWADASHLVGEYMLTEVRFDTSEASTRLVLTCVDRAYILFNLVWSYSYGVGNIYTSPGIIRHTIKVNAERVENQVDRYYGTGHDVGVDYCMDAKFVSEGGYIQDYRTAIELAPTTTLNGSLNSSATSITVVSTTGFEDSGTLVVTDGALTEHIDYTSTSATQFLGCTRGIDDTLAQSYASGLSVYVGFPRLILSKSWKPITEWVKDVSQIMQTNYSDEILAGGTLFYNRAFIMWFDKNNGVHWLNADDTVDLSIDLGEEDVRGLKLQLSVFDSVNFIVYNCGTDMNGSGIMYSYYNVNSNISELKMRYQQMIDLSNTLVNADRQINTARDTTKSTDIYKQYPTSYGPITNWAFKDDSNKFRALPEINQAARTTLSNDAEYNDSLREACKWRGLVQAMMITTKTTGLRYSGDIVKKGVHVNPGDLLSVTNRYNGQMSKLIRVVNVRHQVGANGWETVMSVEEDDRTRWVIG